MKLAFDLDRNVVNCIFQLLSNDDFEVIQEMEDHFLKMDDREFKKEVLLLGNEMFIDGGMNIEEIKILNQLIGKL